MVRLIPLIIILTGCAGIQPQEPHMFLRDDGVLMTCDKSGSSWPAHLANKRLPDVIYHEIQNPAYSYPGKAELAEIGEVAMAFHIVVKLRKDDPGKSHIFVPINSPEEWGWMLGHENGHYTGETTDKDPRCRHG